MTPSDRGTLLVGAVRYALGRQTYYVGDVCRVCRKALHEVSDSDRTVIARDIAEALERGRAGSDIDEREWRALLAWMGVTPRPTSAPPAKEGT